MTSEEQRIKHETIGPHWWVYEIFPEKSKEECDEMIAEWQKKIEDYDVKTNDSNL